MNQEEHRGEPEGFEAIRGAFQKRPSAELRPFRPEWIEAEPHRAVALSEIRDGIGRRVYLAAAAGIFLILGAGIFVLIQRGRAHQGESAAQAPPTRAVAALVTGNVQFFHDGKSAILNTGMMVVEGDRIVTAAGSSVDLGLPGGHMIRIKESSDFLWKTLRSRSAGSREIFAAVAGGDTVVSVRRLTAGEKLTVGTPTAIAGVRGTGFTVQTNGRETTVAVVEGRVEVASPQTSDSKVLEANQGVVVREDGQKSEVAEQVVARSRQDLQAVEASRAQFDEEALQAAQDLAVVKSDEDIARVYNRDPETIRMKNGAVYRGVVASQTGAKLLVVTAQGSYIVDKGDILEILVEGIEK